MNYSDLFKGAVRVKYENGTYSPLRFTQKQLDRYTGIPRCCYPYASSGIKMEFVTGEPEISFGYAFGTVWNFGSPPTFDLYENGVLRQITEGTADSAVHCITYKRRSPEPSEITVYLPVDAETHISDIRIGSYTPVPPKEKKMLLLGDSISQGLMVRYSSLCYAAMIERYYHLDLLNQSVGGDIYDEAALDESLPFDPDTVLVALGTNDIYFLGDYDAIAANIGAYYKKISGIYPGKKVSVITPPYQLGIEGNRPLFDLLGRVTGKIVSEAAVYNFDVIDGFDLVPHDPAFFADQAHPNDLGFSQYAFNLISRLKI